MIPRPLPIRTGAKPTGGRVHAHADRIRERKGALALRTATWLAVIAHYGLTARSPLRRESFIWQISYLARANKLRGETLSSCVRKCTPSRYPRINKTDIKIAVIRKRG